MNDPDPTTIVGLPTMMATFDGPHDPQAILAAKQGNMPEFQRYLVLAPDGQFATQARNALAMAVEQPSGSGSVPPTTAP